MRMLYDTLITANVTTQVGRRCALNLHLATLQIDLFVHFKSALVVHLLPTWEALYLL